MTVMDLCQFKPFLLQICWLLYAMEDHIQMKWPVIKKQRGSNDCGLFAVASATAFCFGMDPTTQDWDQEAMRQHIARCFF